MDKDEYLILVTNLEPKYALGFYKRRWKIETLFTILALAFTWSHFIGEWLNEKEPIKTLKHGRKAKSIFLNSEYFSKELKLIFHFFHFKNLKIGDY